MMNEETSYSAHYHPGSVQVDVPDHTGGVPVQQEPVCVVMTSCRRSDHSQYCHTIYNWLQCRR